MLRAPCPTCGHETFVCDAALAIHGPPSRPDFICPGSGALVLGTESASGADASSGDPGSGAGGA